MTAPTMPESATSTGAGRHMHLDAMESLLAGSPQTPADWNPRHDNVLPGYERQAEAL